MRLHNLLPLLLAGLPLTASSAPSASTSARASVSIRIESKEWLATHDSRLLASSRSISANARGMIQENGSTYLLLDLKGNTYKFEVPQGTETPAGSVQVNYVPLYDRGQQRLVALSINDRALR